MHEKLSPSKAWRDQIFSSGPRRDILKVSKTTTKAPVAVPAQGTREIAEGRNEATALLLLKYLQQVPHSVRRFKSQAFDLGELGGPVGRIPDLLTESEDYILHVIQVKAKRFLTEEVAAKFEVEREFLEPRNFKFHIWTDKDVLSNPLFQNIRIWDRGYRNPASKEEMAAIEIAAQKTSSLAPLLDEFGWDACMAAWADNKFHLSLNKVIDEKSAITLHVPSSNTNYFASPRANSGRWWSALNTRNQARGE